MARDSTSGHETEITNESATTGEARDQAVETTQVPVAQDLLLRSLGRVVRQSIQSGIIKRTQESDEAELLIESRSLVRTLATYGLTRVATKSVPGALLVGGGLVAKMLFDRSQARRDAARKGNRSRHRSKD